MLKQWKESASNKLVFPSTKGTPIDPTNLWRPHNKLLRDLGYVVDGKAKYSFHSYRHTYASAMLYSGLPNHVVANYMGHANGAITETLYAHVLKEVRNTKQAIEHSDNVVMLKGA